MTQTGLDALFAKGDLEPESTARARKLARCNEYNGFVLKSAVAERSAQGSSAPDMLYMLFQHPSGMRLVQCFSADEAPTEAKLKMVDHAIMRATKETMN